MKQLLDFFPILLFFVAYKLYGIYAATLTAIVASIAQVAVYWLKYRRFETMHLLSLGIITVFGGATLFLQDEMFIKWKPTVLNGLFALVFLLSQWIGRKPLIERMMSAHVDAPPGVWRKLNLAWVTFFVVMGATNLFVVYNFDTDAWVNFKLFGLLGLTFLFVLAQSLYLFRYMPQAKVEE
jgi:intracellular septation protein